MTGDDRVQGDVGAVTGENARLMRLATYCAVAVASMLILGKLAAWLLTGSVAILSSLVDSLLDVGASLINLFAVRHALMPADKEHRFGHGKLEALAGLAQAAFISGSAFFLLLEVADRIIAPRPIAHSAIGLYVMAAALALTIALVVFQRYVARRTGSLAISADSMHYTGDILANIGVMAAIVLATQWGWQLADPIFAILVAALIVYGAVGIIRRALDQLMDREWPDAQREQIRQMVMSHPQVRDMHDLRTRTSGSYSFIQFHLELDGDIKLSQAHEISDQVEREIRLQFPDSDVIIHQDPEGLNEPHKMAELG